MHCVLHEVKNMEIFKNSLITSGKYVGNQLIPKSQWDRNYTHLSVKLICHEYLIEGLISQAKTRKKPEKGPNQDNTIKKCRH